jgi:hypothetical protein
MKTNEKQLRSRNFLGDGVRGFVAVALSLLLVPYGGPSLYAQDAPPPPPPQGNYAPLGVEQLNQLVAPIALYPDSLVAQVLTAATYPQQVADANNWLAQNGGQPPQQLAAAADVMPWDPSVKALTAFPSVLANMGRNYNWTAALGNAYYNQPGDVMNAVQAMRVRAQEAGALRSDNHYRVAYDGGLVVIEPYNPAFVYVPYYNPWTIYGGPLVPWGGYYWGGPPRGVVLAGFGLGFGVGISLGLFSHYGWGYNNWSPNWHGGVVVYNHNTYISRSTTVINRGNFGGNNRGVYEHAGPGVPRNFHPAVTAQSAAFRPGQSAPGGYRGSGYSNGRPAGQAAGGQQFGRPGQVGQPGRPQGTPNGQQAPRQFGQQTAGQPGGYRNSPTSRPPVSGGTATPQGNRPQGNIGQAARPQGNFGQANRPQGNTTQPAYRPQAGGAAPRSTAAPAHQQSAPARQQSAPIHQQAPAASHSNGGGGGHTQSKPQGHR